MLTLNDILKKPQGIYGPAIPVALARIFFSVIVIVKYGNIFRINLFKLLNHGFPFGVLVFTLTFFYTVTLMMLFGFKSRFSCFLTSLGCFALYFYEPHHHTFLLSVVVLLIGLAKSGAHLSVDALRNKANQELNIPYWPIILVCVQMSAIYFWGAIDKLTIDFLSGARIETLLWKYWLWGSFEITPIIYAVILFLSWSTLLLELVLSFGLWIKKYQKILIISGVLMHLFMHIFLPIGPFSLMMVGVYFLFYITVHHTYMKQGYKN